MISCPLCSAPEASLFHQRWQKFYSERLLREYYKCPECFYVFLRPDLHLEKDAEQERYDDHENDISEAGYRQFLKQLWEPLKMILSEEDHGLDYGCGPQLSMEILAREDGLEMKSFDPLYYPKFEFLEESYDFVTCSEVAEHFYRPFEEFEILFQLLKPGGKLAVMTGILDDEERFPQWRYTHDLTHVGFFQPRTLKWLESRWDWGLEVVSSRVFFLQKLT